MRAVNVAGREVIAVAVDVVDAGPRSTVDRVVPPQRSGPVSHPARGRPVGVLTGQLVASQTALALLLAAVGRGPSATVLAGLAAAALALGAWVRIRRRWLFEWLAVALGHLTRRRVLGPAAGATELLDLAAPTTQVQSAQVDGVDAAVVCDEFGAVVVLELGDPAELLNDFGHALPAPVRLLPTTGDQLPPVRVQLLLTGMPAPVAGIGGATAATSYRQLTDGLLLGQERAILAIRALRGAGWSDDELVRALSSMVRKVRRRLAPAPARLLDERATLRAVVETALHDDGQPIRGSWSVLHLGGLSQATFRLERWPDPQAAPSTRRLVPRLLALPATATTISISAGPTTDRGTERVEADLTVRLAAPGPAALAESTKALHRLLDAEGIRARRLDGEHLDGLAATLPLARLTGVPRTAKADVLAGFDLPVGTAGLMLGTNRQGEPLAARLFRAAPTRVMLVGGLPAAQLLVLRAMALGARVLVQTVRSPAWEPFVRGASSPGDVITVGPPGRPAGPPGTPTQPLLLVVDAGSVAVDRQPGPGWQATLVVRDQLTPADVGVLARVDLALLQPLRPDEATLAGTALGLGESAQLLTRIRSDMIAVVNRRALRWALLAATPIETQLVGPPTREF